VHPPYRFREPRIAQAAQQSRRRVRPLRRPQRFDEYDLDKTCEHQIAARTLLPCFLADEPHQNRKPFSTAHVHLRRQQRYQQSCVVGINMK